MVTVVDAANLLREYSSIDFIRDRGEALGSDGERTMVDLLVEQIEFADVIVLNKIDDASRSQLDAARKIIRALNPVADMVETNFARVPPSASSTPVVSISSGRGSIRSGSRNCMASPVTRRRANDMA